MTDNSVKDYDAIAGKDVRRIRAGGREFTISHIPAIVSMMFSRHTYGLLKDGEETLDIVDLKLQALVHTLNAGLPAHDRINEEWVMSNISSSVYDDIVDDVLAPFLEARERADKRKQELMIDLFTPTIRALVQEEIQKSLPAKASKNKLNSTLV